MTSKFAIEALGDTLRLELEQFGIQVSLVEPGSIATPIWTKAAGTAGEVVEGITAEQRKLYGRQIQGLRQGLVRAAESGIPAEKVATTIAKALTAPRPKTRYLVGRDAKVNARMSALLPDRATDRMKARRMGL